MMNMFRKFSQLLRTRACGVLFTICLISPLFVVSASANEAFSVEFFSNNGSKSYGFYELVGGVSTYYDSDSETVIVAVIEHTDWDEPSEFLVSADQKILGWSLSPFQTVADFDVGRYFTYDDLSAYGSGHFDLYLVLESEEEPEPSPVEPPVVSFKPFAQPSSWDSGGNYSVSGYCDYTLLGDPDIDIDTQVFPVSYPTVTQIVELASQYNTFRPQITLQFSEDSRSVYYNILVRQAWYVDGEIPANIQVNDVGLDGTITLENLKTDPTATSMYSIYSFDNSIDCTTIVDRTNGVIYFDYRISVYIPDSIPEPLHSGHKARFDLKHKNTVSGLSIDTERSYTTLVSAYGEVTEEDMLAQVKYEAYRDKSDEKMEQGEAIIKDIESLVKPDPEQIVPDFLPDQEELQPITDAFSPFFQNALIVQLCTMVLGFAFVSYVLFGKKG